MNNKPESTLASHESNSANVVAAASVARHYSGPIPPASEMAKYEEISPGAANRLLVLMEQQAQHRQNMESLVIQSSVRDQRLGIIFAFVIVISALVVGLVCVRMGHPFVGAAIVASGISSIVAAFIYGTRSNRAERQEKADRNS